MQLRDLPYIFLGSTKYGGDILESLLQKGCIPKAIFSIPEYFSISYSKTQVRNYNFYDFETLAKQNEIPFYWVDQSTPLQVYADKIKEWRLEFMLVAGWYYKIPPPIYTLSKLGAFGFHSSLLPKYAGGAPLVWAMINGESKSGVTLFQMQEQMDNGDIIMQESFDIAFSDTIQEVLHKSTQCAIAMSLKLFDKDYHITFTPQNAKQEYYPQRSPSDGEIDLSWDSTRLYNFIRAQSSPYPGAFIKTIDGKKLVIDKAHIQLESSGGGGAFSSLFVASFAA